MVFDAMGVIFEVGDDTNDLVVPFVRERNGRVSQGQINDLYRLASLGQITSEAFWRAVGLGAEYPQVENAYLNTCFTLDAEFKPVAARLAQAFKLGILSNDVKEWSSHLRARHGLDCFDAVAISGEVGYRKPDVKIYNAFLQMADASPEACVFVDDRTKNLNAANTLGFKTVYFQRKPPTEDFVPDSKVGSFHELETIAKHFC